MSDEFDKYFICIKPSKNISVAWNLYRGQFSSPLSLSSNDKPISFHLANLLKNLHINNLNPFEYNQSLSKLKKELQLERVRSKLFPEKPSRLTAIYLWQDRSSAEIATNRWAEEHFEENWICDVSFTHRVKPAILDTTWIDQYVLNIKLVNNHDEKWMEKYWSGIYTDEPLLEVLADGAGVFWELNHRKQAYEHIFLDPDQHKSLGALELCRIITDSEILFNLNRKYGDFGHFSPVLGYSPKHNHFRLINTIYAPDDLSKEFLEKDFQKYLNKVHKKEINTFAIDMGREQGFTVPYSPEITIISATIFSHSEKNVLKELSYNLDTSYPSYPH